MTGKKRITAGVMAALLLLVFLIGRYDGVWKPHRKSASPYPAQTVVMAGSTSMEKFANMLAECYREANPGVTVTAEFTGSSAGVQAVLSERADIGLSSRTLTTAEEASGAAAYVIAMDGIAVITDRDNPVTALTTKQLADIYTGQIRDWQELGGRKQPIVVAGREAGSGTRSAFEELLGISDEFDDTFILNPYPSRPCPQFLQAMLSYLSSALAIACISLYKQFLIISISIKSYKLIAAITLSMG